MAVSPIAAELKRGEPLSAAVDMTGVTADSEGFYYAPGQIVQITGNATVKKATTSGEAFGIVTIGIHDGSKQGVKLSPDTASRVNVLPFEFQQALIRAVAAETLVAGDRVVLDTTTAGRVKKAGAGEKGFGKIWIGGGAASVVQILV